MNGFDYHRPGSLAEAAALLTGDAALLAGGHTLIPAMKTGLRQPSALIDLAAIPGLAGITVEGDRLRIGAMTRHAAIAASAEVARLCPGLADAARQVGDPAVRARGTLGGAIANNDPAADYPAALLAFDAEIETDRRRIAAGDFLVGMFTTALEEGEIIVAVRFAAAPKSAYAKFRHPASRYAIAGVLALHSGPANRVTVAGVAPVAFRWTAAEAALDREFSAASVQGLALDPAELLGDLHASAEYRAHLAQVMLARAVTAAATRS